MFLSKQDLDEARMKEELATSHTSSHVPDCILEQHEGNIFVEQLIHVLFFFFNFYFMKFVSELLDFILT